VVESVEFVVKGGEGKDLTKAEGEEADKCDRV